MKLRKSGKCVVCKTPTVVHRTFDEPVDMFDPGAESSIKGDLKENILVWRNEPILCEEHLAYHGSLLGSR